MKIEFEIFHDWAKQNFTDIKVKANKIRLNSIYCDDQKYHLWCRPHTGHYHCYKSGIKGTLYKLVMDVEGCSYPEAIDILGGKQTLRHLEEKLEIFLRNEKIHEEKQGKIKLILPPHTLSIDKLIDPYKTKVVKYLESRKLSHNGLYYCISGDYSGRIVIPYYDSDGNLIYFNARSIDSKLRYRGPEINTGFKKDEVVWMSFFPRKGAKIYLTEGEFDAMTLNLCGLHGCATGGKDVSTKQILMVAHYNICLAFDTDPSGKNAFLDVGWRLKENGVKNVTFVRPPEPYKDWNEMLAGKFDKQPLNEKIIYSYIVQNEKPFNEFTSSLLNS